MQRALSHLWVSRTLGVFHLLAWDLKTLSVKVVSDFISTYEASECLSERRQALARTITQVQANIQHCDLDN